MAVDHNNPQSRNEEILIAAIDGKEYDKIPQSRIEELLLELKEVIEAGGGGTTNYNLLSNRPTVNNILLEGNKTADDLSLVLAEVGKGLSTNDYSNEEKAKVASLLTSIQSILDGTDIDSFGDVEIALLDKADISDLGTAAAKDSTNAVISGSTDLVESGAVKDAIDAAVAAAYHHAGTKTVAQLTHDLLIAANEGNVYEMTDSGTTTSDFMEGMGRPIKEGDNVGVARVSEGVYKFNLLSGFVDTTNFVQKSQTAGLLKNDGTVNDEIEDDVDQVKSGFTNLDNEVNGDATTYPYADVITISDAIPANLADCSVKIEPVQSGSGDPSPDNVRPITGHTKVSVERYGFNIWNGTATDGKGVGNGGELYNDATLFATGYVRVFPNVTYYLNGTNWKNWVWVFDGNRNALQEVRVNTADRSIVFPSGTVYARFTGILDSKSTACINVFNSALNGSYEPYSGKTYTISLGDTIYGGTVDFDSGVMTVDRACFIGDGSSDEDWNITGTGRLQIRNISNVKQYTDITNEFLICSIAVKSASTATLGTITYSSGYFVLYLNEFKDKTLDEWKAYIASNPLQICYELSTPTTIQLTPKQIQLLKGQNTLTSSTGDISVTVNGVSGAIGQVQEQANELESVLTNLLALTIKVGGDLNPKNFNYVPTKPISLNQIGNSEQYENKPSGVGTYGILISFKTSTYIIQLWISTGMAHRIGFNNGESWSGWYVDTSAS